MQQVTNSSERNQAFVKFLLFFLVTVALVVAAVFFNTRMPTRENKMLQSELDEARVQDQNQQKFVNRMTEAIRLVDSLDKKGVNFEQINLQLNSKLQELAQLQQHDNTLDGQMQKMIIDKLSDLQQAKQTLMEANTNINKMSSAAADLEKCQSQNLQLQATLDSYKKAAGGL